MASITINTYRLQPTVVISLGDERVGAGVVKQAILTPELFVPAVTAEGLVLLNRPTVRAGLWLIR